MDLLKREYSSLSYISGPLLFVKNARELAYNAIVEIKDGGGRVRGGQVIEVSEDTRSFRYSRRPQAWTWPGLR